MYNREVERRIEQKTNQLSRLGIFITDVSELQENADLCQQYLNSKIYTKAEIEDFLQIGKREVQYYQKMLDKEVETDILVPEPLKGEMTLEEFVNYAIARKAQAEKIICSFVQLQVQLMREYLEKEYMKLLKEARQKGKERLSVKTPDCISEHIDFEREQDVYRGNMMNIRLDKAEEGLEFLMRYGVNLLLEGNNRLIWSVK